MILHRNSFLSIALCILFISCQTGDKTSDNSDGQKETIEVAEVNVSQKAEDNLQTANDVSAFDFRELVAERLNVTDTAVLNAISWSTIPNSNGTSAKIQLELGQAAVSRKAEIEALFKTFSHTKIEEYKVKNSELPNAESAAVHYLKLIATSTIDTVWLNTSPTLTKFASKDEFNKTLIQRKQLFHPQGTRRVLNRRVSNQLGESLKGDFCTITFMYDNAVQEEVTLEKINGVYKLLGYHFVVIPE